MAKDRHRRKSLITGVAVTAGGVLGITQPALADTFQVNASDDAGDGVCQDVAAGDCTLRDAVIEANDNTGVFDDITFASSITGVTLGGTELGVTDGVYIQGNGADATTISGNDASRLFNLDPGASEPVAFRDLTLTGGAAGGGYGGAIYNQNASLEISSSVLTLNSANKGGAILDVGTSGQSSEITGSTISQNTAADDGAGIFAGGSAGKIFNSTISGNHAGATGDDYGGGLFISDDTYLYDTTVTGNSAGYGGGIYANTGTVAYVENSIVGGNTATAPGGNFPPGVDIYGLVTAGFSLIQLVDDGTKVTDDPAGSNIIGSDPQLGPLQDNGGPTPTQKPALSSPVIDKGLSDSDVDQRGSARPFDVPSIINLTGGNAADMGAVELQKSDFPAPPSGGGGGGNPPPPPDSATGQRAASLKKCKQKAKKKHWAKKRLKKCKKKARRLPV